MTPHEKRAAAPALKIRRARARDAARIAELSIQLGYPVTDAQIGKRLRRLLRVSKHVVFVAEKLGAGVIGWLHASVQNLVESEIRVEINGLIVADGHRSIGAGAKLLDAAEQWARKNGCKNVNLRCNVMRERAHGFYLRQGYDHYKTQKAFRKAL